jgi:LPS sulfotransferase NodH
LSRPKLFVILTTQRSGSSWLVDLLDDHPLIAAYGELFRVTDTSVFCYGATAVPNFEVMVGPQTFSVSPGLAARRLRYVRGLARAHPEARAVGFKLMYDQTRDHGGLLGLLGLLRVKFVHLVRRDSLSAIVSFDIATERARWHFRSGDAVHVPRIRTDPESLVERLQRRDQEIERFRRRLARMAVPVHEVAYEDLLARHQETLSGVVEFLGLPAPARPLHSTLVRPTQRRPIDLVENRDDVVAALAGTEYEALAA